MYFLFPHLLSVQALLLAVDINSTDIYTSQLRDTKRLLHRVWFCIPICPPALRSLPTAPYPSLSSPQKPSASSGAALTPSTRALPGSCRGKVLGLLLLPEAGYQECTFGLGKHWVKQSHVSYFLSYSTNWWFLEGKDINQVEVTGNVLFLSAWSRKICGLILTEHGFSGLKYTFTSATGLEML